MGGRTTIARRPQDAAGTHTMPDHVVTLDDSTDPPAIRLPELFNIAVHFIDRHPAEGREAKGAIRPGAEEVTYGERAERVNRCGNVLKTLDI